MLVIGDDAVGDYLVSQGLLLAPGAPFSSFSNGTVFTRPGGFDVFLKDTFTFNGDDALELQLNYVRCDVFGQPGVDPGSEWTSNGISTADQNLSRAAMALAAAGPGTA